MDNDIIPFLIGVGLLVSYLIFSAVTSDWTELIFSPAPTQ